MDDIEKQLGAMAIQDGSTARRQSDCEMTDVESAQAKQGSRGKMAGESVQSPGEKDTSTTKAQERPPNESSNKKKAGTVGRFSEKVPLDIKKWLESAPVFRSLLPAHCYNLRERKRTVSSSLVEGGTYRFTRTSTTMTSKFRRRPHLAPTKGTGMGSSPKVQKNLGHSKKTPLRRAQSTTSGYQAPRIKKSSLKPNSFVRIRDDEMKE